MKLISTLILLAWITLPIGAQAQTFSGTATALDGDRLSVSGISIRLFGIDAPELGQTCSRSGTSWPCGEEARQSLAKLVTGQRVECRGRGIDTYGRTLAVCATASGELNRALVEQGWATAFRKYSDAYVAEEVRARAAAAGIWSSEFEAPEAFRSANQPSIQNEAQLAPLIVRSGRQQQPAAGSGCVIKGNRNRRGEWIYHLPGMPYYEATNPEEMFCTEAQAQAAGYRRARVRR
jgi:endonuclease YncB( thermonuclease family)